MSRKALENKNEMCSRQNLMNLKMDDRPIEHKPSTKLLWVHIDEMLTWDNQIKHI